MIIRDKVAVLDKGYDSYEYEKKLFSENGYRFHIFPGKDGDRSGKIKFAEDAAGIFIRGSVIDDPFLNQTPRLRAISRYGTGYDNIDIASTVRHGVKVANVSGYANHSVSDHAIALMFACARALPQGKRSLRCCFGRPPVKQVIEFQDKILGIIGLGRIGSTLCRKVLPVFKEVLACDPYIPEERFREAGACMTGLDNLLKRSDVVSIHCNLTEETTGLIHRENMCLMKKRPILINTARGAVIDESDLVRGLKAGQFHSVGLDVFSEEPPVKMLKWLSSHPQVIATGHYAWYSDNASVELQRRAANNLLSMLQGETPGDCLNPEAV